MTVDVEDYYHAAALAQAISPAQWQDWPSHVEANTDVLLQMFADAEIKATFFILGWVAEQYPSIVRRIAEQGHEIACHGFSHQLIYSQSPETFRQESARAKNVIEQIAAKPVIGYRAASYSITEKSLWALDILAELGFCWDSSIFPIHHDRYGMPGMPCEPYEIRTGKGNHLIEFPLTTSAVLGSRIPVSGGGYFRQFPYWLFKRLFMKAASEHRGAQMFYIHPWEIDPGQPHVKGLSVLSQFRHYRNLDCCQQRLQQMLSDFEFGTVEEAYHQLH
ncbi:MAG: DUF3473 domain-containing protein [Pseudomonadales bacterium]|nr:DUF3473 domain-containing protein [Pseudomonadales bacterium]